MNYDISHIGVEFLVMWGKCRETTYEGMRIPGMLACRIFFVLFKLMRCGQMGSNLKSLETFLLNHENLCIFGAALKEAIYAWIPPG
jgi:hypothetical protein